MPIGNSINESSQYSVFINVTTVAKIATKGLEIVKNIVYLHHIT